MERADRVARSMTGFGVGERMLGPCRLVVELRSFNQRGIEVTLRVPPPLAGLSSAVESRVRQRVGRGRVDVSLHLDAPESAAVLDAARARAVMAALDALRVELGRPDPVPVSVLAGLPELFSGVRLPEREATLTVVTAAIDDALAALVVSQEVEGAVLVRDLRGRVESMRAHVSTLHADVPAALGARKERLRDRLGRWIGEQSVTPDPPRMEAELALLADRLDVTEELTRLGAHLDRLATLLDEAEPGREIEFLLQEIVREVNTLGSKIPDVSVSPRVIALKVEAERIREQARNLA